MNKQQIKKYTVNVVKSNQSKGTYHVLALSAGGAENTVLRNVYAAYYALATEGWAANVTCYDLVSDAAKMASLDLARAQA